MLQQNGYWPASYWSRPYWHARYFIASAQWQQVVKCEAGQTYAGGQVAGRVLTMTAAGQVIHVGSLAGSGLAVTCVAYSPLSTFDYAGLAADDYAGLAADDYAGLDVACVTYVLPMLAAGQVWIPGADAGQMGAP